MKTKKLIFIIANSIISFIMLMSSIMYFLKTDDMIKGMEATGLPYHFFQILGTAKILGVIALWIPQLKTLNEWAYAGFTFVLIGALWIHISTHTSFVLPIGVFVVLAVSYIFRRSFMNKAIESMEKNNTP